MIMKKIKKTLVFTLGLSILFTTSNALPTFAGSKTFSDVSDTHWAKPAIEKLAEDGVINGYPDGTFKPEKVVSQVEFAKMVVIAAVSKNEYEKYVGKTWTNKFKEVYDSNEKRIDVTYTNKTWYDKYRTYLMIDGLKAPFTTTNNGVYYGLEETCGVPDITLKSATRYDAAYMTYQVLTKSLGENDFIEDENEQAKIKDFSDIISRQKATPTFENYFDKNNEFVKAVKGDDLRAYGYGADTCLALGIMNGLPDKSFSGNKTLTRAEAAQIIYKLKYKEAREKRFKTHNDKSSETNDEKKAILDKKKKELDSALNSAGVTKNMTDREKVDRIADYLIKKYNKKTPCRVFSNEFKDLCNRAYVDCREVIGKSVKPNSTGSHSWNQVKVDGVWYWIDVTWMSAGNEYKESYSLMKSTINGNEPILWSTHEIYGVQEKDNFDEYRD